MAKDIILSGIKPTGELHLGNYLGALKNFVALQENYQCYFFLATSHSLTVDYQPKEKRRQILDLAKAYLACGVDPKQSVIFDQTDVPAHFELNWIFNCLTPVAEAERMTQFKDKTSKQAKNINIGLLDYPILQAADILIYHANKIPVGQDQVQHVELTRKIARWFNNRYGQYFIEPEPLLTNIPKVQSLIDPSVKMSKTDGANSYVALIDESELIQKKIRKAVTGSGTEDTIPPGAENLLMIIDELGHHEVREKYLKQIKEKAVRYSELKDEVAQIIADHFDNFRHIYKNVSDAEVEKILKSGAEQANEVANKTINEVRKLIGIK